MANIFVGQSFRYRVAGSYQGRAQTIQVVVFGTLTAADIADAAAIRAFIDNDYTNNNSAKLTVWTFTVAGANAVTAFSTDSPALTLPAIAVGSSVHLGCRLRMVGEGNADSYWGSSNVITVTASALTGVTIATV